MPRINALRITRLNT